VVEYCVWYTIYRWICKQSC